jgi:hypothetical protein
MQLPVAAFAPLKIANWSRGKGHLIYETGH